MIIKNLQIKNFRNYDKLNFNLEKNLNILIGDNAQGKTSILEAIYILGITKSHITNNDIEYIKYDKLTTVIRGKVEVGGYLKNLDIIVDEKSKKIKINGKKITKIREYISKLNIIIFSPLDLELVKGSPNIRRKFLNIEIGQLDNNYLDILSKYNKIIKTRNEYLKTLNISKQNNISYLEVLNDKYIEYAIKIYEYRINFIKEINKNIGIIFNNITTFEKIHINYIPNIKLDINTFNKNDIKEQLIKKINQNLNREIFLGITIYGPHRDDFSFFINDKDISIYGSQGQQRCAVISLKLSEINIFQEILNDSPIVLLDDIFSELDKKTRNHLLNYLNKDIQVIITTNDLNNISKKIIKKANIKVINAGKIEEV